MLLPLGNNIIEQRILDNYHQYDSNVSSEKETPSFLDNIFFAVPKQRKTVEQRLRSRFGAAQWGPHGSKMLKRRFDLVTCETCGNYREKIRLCLHCFNRVEEESKTIKEAIAREYGLNPVEKPMEIRYKNDPKNEVTDKILIEVDKERPIWFSKNLLQRANEIIPEKSVTISDDGSKK